MEVPIRVLLVDDVAAFRSVARAYLREISEIQLIGEASGGDEALEQLERLQPDLVLMDVHMSRGNGLATVRRIRTRRKGPPRVVLFSLQADDVMRRAAFAAGADDFFSKGDFVQGVTTALARLSKDLLDHRDD